MEALAGRFMSRPHEGASGFACGADIWTIWKD